MVADRGAGRSDHRLYSLCRLNHNQKPKVTMHTIIEKLKEESTWRGLIAIAMACGLQLDPELQHSILVVGLALMGIINIKSK
jgi:hypothetical protein